MILKHNDVTAQRTQIIIFIIIVVVISIVIQLLWYATIYTSHVMLCLFQTGHFNLNKTSFVVEQLDDNHVMYRLPVAEPGHISTLRLSQLSM